jgi:hypothetical protein
MGHFYDLLQITISRVQTIPRVVGIQLFKKFLLLWNSNERHRCKKIGHEC